MEELQVDPQGGFWGWGRLKLHFWSDWSDILGWKRMNWIDMELIRLHFERAYYKNTFEVNVALLGLNLCVEWQLRGD